MGFKSLGKNVRISDRAAIYDAGRIQIGDNSRIDDFCVISGRIKLGRNVHLAVFCNIAGGAKGVTIGDFSGVAYGSQVFAQSDDYTGRALTGPTVPAEFTKVSKKAVQIGRHCIVGASSVILPGVSLGDGTAVGAMSLVLKATQPWSIYLGIPAKRVGARGRQLLALERKYLASEK
jgi:galactoside O-acetyltransferase